MRQRRSTFGYWIGVDVSVVVVFVHVLSVVWVVITGVDQAIWGEWDCAS